MDEGEGSEVLGVVFESAICEAASVVESVGEQAFGDAVGTLFEVVLIVGDEDVARFGGVVNVGPGEALRVVAVAVVS